jgi:putative oxidoreductase
MRSLLFGGVKGSSRMFDFGLLPLRVCAGLALALAHGLQKVPPTPQFVEHVAGFGFPVPGLFAWAAAFAEVGGGILLALGLLTRPAAFLILCNMVVAFVFAHAQDPFPLKEKALLFGNIAFLFLCLGAGRFSLDARFVKR